VQLEAPLHTGAATYDPAAAEHLRITRLALHGKPVTLRPSEHGSVVVASFHGGQLHVSPVAKVVQLRPSLGHVDAADERRRAEVERTTQQAGRGAAAEAAPRAEEVDADADEEDGDGAPQQRGLHLLQTRIRRPDAQSAQSLARAHEEAEQWLPLMVHGERSPVSTAVLHHLRTAHSDAGAAGQPVSAAAYLEALLPKQTHVSASKAMASHAQQGNATEAREVREPVARATGPPRPGPSLDALPAVLHAMVTARGQFLVSAGAVRDLLRMSPAAAGVRGATELSDEQLAQGLGPGWVAIQGRLVASTTGDAMTDALRAKVVALLKAKASAGEGAPSVRKQDVTAVAGGELGAGPSSLYSRVMRGLCDSSTGGVWVLRAGEAPAEGARRRAKKGAAGGGEGEDVPMDDSDCE
jgi:hypothetical protein